MGKVERKAKSLSSNEQAARPAVFSFHDYRAFLKDWFAYLKQNERGFSLRKLSLKAGLAVGFLPMVLSGRYQLTRKALEKLAPVLGLTHPEQTYFESLVRLAVAETPEARIEALSQMKRYVSYRRSNPNETEAFGYWSHWYHAAIREMTFLPDFKADPDWIRTKLRKRITRAEAESAIEFLTSNGYVEIGSSGAVIPPKEQLKCVGNVYKAVLTHFHKQMFGMAADSIDEALPNERNIVGHTLAIDSNKFDEVKKILDEALERIQNYAGAETSDSVYHIEVALFPLTRREGA